MGPGHVIRSSSYAFVLDEGGLPIELGSGRSAKVYLGEERWIESKTDFRREVVIKVLQKGVSRAEFLRFRLEKELLERVQGHPNIVRLHASGEAPNDELIPRSIRGQVENDFLVLERLDESLEERLNGTRTGVREDLLAFEPRERLFLVLQYVLPVASAIEFAHLVRDICHRDIKPANILLGRRHPYLRGAILDVRLADFNTAKVRDDAGAPGLTRTSHESVPGGHYFQAPEQATNSLELSVNVVTGSTEVDYFEDFYLPVGPGDAFSLFNREAEYSVATVDRAHKKIQLAHAYGEESESSVKARVRKTVGRPADIYSIGALFYYLVSGANPKTLHDDFHKFIEYDGEGSNTVDGYLAHQYALIDWLRGRVPQRPWDPFFSHKPFLDGNGELVDRRVMRVIAKCMIRNKPDSYCQAHDLGTMGVRELVTDLLELYGAFGARSGLRSIGSPSGVAARRGRRGRARAGGRPGEGWWRLGGSG